LVRALSRCGSWAWAGLPAGQLV